MSFRRTACVRSCVRHVCECRAAVKLRNALCHRSVEAAPMCSSKMLGYDEVDTLAERLLGRKAKQQGTGGVPADDHSRAVDTDDSVSDLIENPLGQFHGSSLDWNSPARLITA